MSDFEKKHFTSTVHANSLTRHFSWVARRFWTPTFRTSTHTPAAYMGTRYFSGHSAGAGAEVRVYPRIISVLPKIF